MTDWKPGDRFKLECEGAVKRLSWFGDEDELRVDLYGEGEFPVGHKWFDAHATKIHPSCGAIRLNGMGAAMPCSQVAVQRVKYPDETRYFCSKHRIEAEDL